MHDARLTRTDQKKRDLMRKRFLIRLKSRFMSILISANYNFEHNPYKFP